MSAQPGPSTFVPQGDYFGSKCISNGGFVSLPGSALADQVTLKNGDRLTGTIVKTDEDKLEFKSEFAGDVKLPWSAVVAIVSAEPLHVALKNGKTIVGVVTTKDEKFEVAAPSGPVEAPKAEVAAVRNNAEQDVYMRMEHPRLIDLWAGLLDAGLRLTRGNSESTSFALTGKAARTTKRTKVTLYSTEIYSRSTLAGVSNTTASAIRAGARLDVNLRGRSFAFDLAISSTTASRIWTCAVSWAAAWATT